jgi:uncharacterized damage-inducible protein DinB
MSTANLSSDTTRLLRHLIATIAFRSSRALTNAPEGFADERLAEGGMTARELLLHMSNVMSFALATVTGTERVRHEAAEWTQEVDRFYSLLGQVDAKLAAGASMEAGMDLRLVQGPLADALTHVGQLHAIRRKTGHPVPPTNYIKADVQAGRTALRDQGE